MVFCSQPSEKANLSATPVQKQNLVLITPRNHPLAGQDTIDLKETVSYPQIYFEKSAGIRSVIDQMFLNIGETPNIAYETEEDQVIAGLVAQGFGIAIVPYMDLLLKLDVKILPIVSPNCEQVLFMVHDERVFMPPAVQNFRQFVLERNNIFEKN